ncbi:TPA: sodium:solute symporter [Citrobacter koseri]
MKKTTEIAMWTLLLSTLAGIGMTAGFFCFIGTARLLMRVLA